jgi:predicted SprT family Zn-dependent metalloprotease
MLLMMDRFEAMRTRTKEVLEKAELLYGVKIDPKITFNLKGRVAGWAGCKFCRITRQARDFTLRFNSDIIQGKHFDDMMELTIPHEVAHLVCYARPDLGSKHNPGWKRVCMALGGNGSRTHSYETAPGRGNGFTYRASCGTEITVSSIIHRKIQAGQGRVLKKTRGKVDRFCAWAPQGMPLPLVRPSVKTAEYVPPVPKIVVPPMKVAPKVAAPKVVKVQGEMTWAEKVRQLIRAHKPQGTSQETVISLAIMELGMTKDRARSCVKAHWDKV